MNEEYIDIVDQADSVIGTDTRDEINRKKLPHRIVHVIIFNKKREMALQLRSEHKSFCPLHWCTRAGGYVQSGETYEQAAVREFEEEMGVKAPVHMLFKDYYEDASGNKKFITTFSCHFDGEFTPDPMEVAEVRWFTHGELKELLACNPKIHPELMHILQKHQHHFVD